MSDYADRIEKLHRQIPAAFDGEIILHVDHRTLWRMRNAPDLYAGFEYQPDGSVRLHGVAVMRHAMVVPAPMISATEENGPAIDIIREPVALYLELRKPNGRVFSYIDDPETSPEYL